MFLELTQSLLHGVLCHISVTPVRGQLVVKMEKFKVVPSNKSQSVGSQFLWLDPSKPKMYPAFLVLPILKGKNTIFLYVSHYVCNLRCAELLLSVLSFALSVSQQIFLFILQELEDQEQRYFIQVLQKSAFIFQFLSM